MFKSLEEAMLQLKKGDVDALEYIYNETHKGVFTFILPILRDYTKAEDIMEQTYVHLYETADKYEQDGSALNWILTIAKNLALGELNKTNRELAIDFSDPLNVNLVYEHDKEIDEGPTIALANRILTPEEFQIVTMHAIGGYKHREIADILDLPLGTVTWKYNEAIKKLRKELEKERLS